MIFAHAKLGIENWLRAREHRDESNRISPGRLRYVVDGVLQSMNLHLVDAEDLDAGEPTQLVAMGTGSFRDTRHVVMIAAAPPNDVVLPHTLEQLSDAVERCDAASGMLFTPYHIDRGQWDPGELVIQLFDGLALKRLVAHHLPHLHDELDGYRMVGTEPALSS